MSQLISCRSSFATRSLCFDFFGDLIGKLYICPTQVNSPSIRNSLIIIFREILKPINWLPPDRFHRIVTYQCTPLCDSCFGIYVDFMPVSSWDHCTIALYNSFTACLTFSSTINRFAFCRCGSMAKFLFRVEKQNYMHVIIFPSRYSTRSVLSQTNLVGFTFSVRKRKFA